MTSSFILLFYQNYIIDPTGSFSAHMRSFLPSRLKHTEMQWKVNGYGPFTAGN